MSHLVIILYSVFVFQVCPNQVLPTRAVTRETPRHPMAIARWFTRVRCGDRTFSNEGVRSDMNHAKAVVSCLPDHEAGKASTTFTAITDEKYTNFKRFIYSYKH